MVIFCDTSVLVAGCIEEHQHHGKTLPLIQKIVCGKLRSAIASHSLAECFASMTAIPAEQPISPEQAREAIENQILTRFEVVALTARDYREALSLVTEKNLKSGAIYDALIYQAASKRKADYLVTWNQKHFQRFSPTKMKIVTPPELL